MVTKSDFRKKIERYMGEDKLTPMTVLYSVMQLHNNLEKAATEYKLDPENKAENIVIAEGYMDLIEELIQSAVAIHSIRKRNP